MVNSTKVQPKFPRAISFLVGEVVPHPVRDTRTVEDLVREGYTPIGKVARMPYDKKLGYPLGRQPARLARLKIEETNPKGLDYDGIAVGVQGSQLYLQAYKK